MSGATVALPVGIDLDDDMVTVIDVEPASVDPHEPFLVMTAERLMSEGHPGHRTPMTSLISATADPLIGDVPDPIAFVMHTGRCGSTLLTNLLAARRDVMVFREPDPVAPLLERATRLQGAEQHHAGAALDAVIRSYSVFAAEAGCGAVIKLPSPAASLAPALAARYPTTPFVGVWRNPVSSIASFLAGSPPWAARLYDRSELQARWWPVLARPRTGPLTAIRFFSRCWVSGVDGMLGVPPDHRWLLDYHRLTSNPEQVVEGLTSRFGLSESEPVSPDRVRAVAGTYAKDPGHTEAYEPDGRHQRAPLPPDAEAEVRQLTAPAVQRLRNAGQPADEGTDQPLLGLED